MRKLIAMLVVVVGMATAPVAEAEILSGEVSRIYVTSSGAVNFRISGACKASTYFFFNLSSDHGKAWYAMLLNAATTRQSVRVSIADTCDPAVNQSVAYVYQDYE